MGGLTTAVQFTQQKAPILAKELKKTVGVTRIYSRVETYVRARMEELIKAARAARQLGDTGDR